MGLIIGILLAIPLGLIPANIAKKKGHSFGLWWFYGWALFIVAIIHVNFIEDYNAPKNNFSSQQYSSQSYTGQQTISKPSYVNAEPQKSKSFNDVSEELKTLKELLDGGVLTQEEFDAKKKEILSL